MTMTILIFLIITFFSISTVLSREPNRNDSNVENVIGSVVGDELSSEIATDNTRAYLSCESGEMVVKINFTEPYLGVIYTNYDRSSPCKLYGDGRQYYELRIPLKGCGTKQKVSRVFINNILVRFHRSLELDEDEVKTIICRYPPPLAPPPNNVIPPELEPTPPLAAIATPKLSEVEILLIVCALLFLTLLLLGVGVAYYCLKKRNVKIVRRRRTASSAPGSEITKLSSSTRGPITTIETINIPRASAITGSGSDAALLTSGSSQHGSGGTSETLPSDYPSESPSSINSDEETDGHKNMSVQDISSMRNGGYKFHNSAFVPDEGPARPVYPSDHDNFQSTASFSVETTNKPFEYRNDGRRQKIVKHMLTTIIEREDSVQTESFNERLTRQQPSSKEEFRSTSEYVPNTSLQLENLKKDSFFMSYTSSPSFGTNVLDNGDFMHSETVEFLPVNKKVLSSSSHYTSSLYGSIPDNDNRSQTDVDFEPPVRPYIRKPKLQVSTLDDYFLDTWSSTEIQEDKGVIRWSHLPGDQKNESTNSIDGHDHEQNLQPQRKSQITLQNIDEVYFSKTDETNLTEYSTKYRKEITNQHSRASESWDVKFRHSPPMSTSDNSRSENWGKESEKVRDNESTITEPDFKAKFQDSAYPESKPKNKFSVQDVVFRVLQSPPTNGAKDISSEDKEKWKKLIHSDKTFRSLIQEATTTEELARISRDKRYEHLYTPKKWQVIIRVLTAPDYNYTSNNKEQCQQMKQTRYKKKTDYDSRGRKSSLSPLYEVDSETSFSNKSSPVSVHSRRTSRSVGSLRDFDWRSMTEMDVDFTHADKESLWSLDTYRTARSAAERSCSEFVEEVPTISSRHRSSQFPVLERLTLSPETILRSKDCEFAYDYDGVPGALLSSSSSHLKRFVDGRRNCSILERSSSPILRTLDRASSVGEREEIKSTTETDIYDWQR